MLPETYNEISVIKDSPSKTYKIDWDNNRILGFIDGKDAVAQSIELALTTERYVWDIYSWNYGSDIHTLIGQNDVYAMSEMKSMIKDALSPDGRVTDVSDFQFIKTKDGLDCSFTATTTVGEVNGTV